MMLLATHDAPYQILGGRLKLGDSWCVFIIFKENLEFIKVNVILPIKLKFNYSCFIRSLLYLVLGLKSQDQQHFLSSVCRYMSLL